MVCSVETLFSYFTLLKKGRKLNLCIELQF